MRRGILILFWLLFISHQAAVCQAQDSGDKMKRPVADANMSLFSKAWLGIDDEMQTAPVGLIDRLPPDGTWARFEQGDNYVTIASVGKMVVAGQPYRWIEVVLEMGGQELIWKLLISETLPKRSRNILEQALSIWHYGLQREQRNITGMSPADEFGELTFILTGPDSEIRLLEPQTIETKLGRFECSGWTGRQLTRFGSIEFDATFRQWVHEKAPFGVLRSEIELSSKFNDNIRQTRDSITLVEVGTGAQSRISTADLSIEELTAQLLAPAAGWQWAVLPGGAGWASMGTLGLAMAMNKNDRELRFTLAYPSTSGGPGGVQYRPVAFDGNLRRYELGSRGGAGSGMVGLAVFALDRDVLPADQVKYIGVEKLDQQADKEPVSLTGTLLPDFLNVGFNFVPERPDDKAFLICFFDMNQRPSRNCITELNGKAKQLKEMGLAVIGIQASKVSEDELDRWIQQGSIHLPMGMIKGNIERTLFSWNVRSLPWLILADRSQIVRAEGFALAELDEKLKANK
ncbi:MAG: hypothetical protein A2Z38_10535 [Planctomycetes bacterium RBG_19FT_COMBO_48_8]|nr:MAG: hypothetical protein A2Z38_10535 [Planctomycetes bacterium RBG_19FT_COMBO_48_8]